MKRNLTRLLIEVLTSISIYFSLFSVLNTILMFNNNDNSIMKYTAIALCMPFAQTLYKNITSNVLFYIMHFLTMAVCILFVIKYSLTIPQILTYSTVWIIMACITIKSGIDANSKNMPRGNIAPAVFMILSYGISSIWGNYLLTRLICYMTVLSIVFYLICRYLSNMFIFFEANSISGVIHTRSIFKNSLKLSGTFIIVASVFMGIAAFFPTGNIFLYIKDAMYSFFKFLFSFVKTDYEHPISSATPKPTVLQPTQTPEKTMETPTPVPTINPVVRAIDNNLAKPAILICIAFVIIFAVAIMYGMKKRKKEIIENSTFILPFESSQKVTLENNNKKTGLLSRLFNNSPEQKIRKTFRKTITINQRIGEKILSSHTPSQLCDTTSYTNDNNDMIMLKNIYEKARYSNEQCSKEDAITATTISKKLNP